MLLAALRQPGLPPPHGFELIPDSQGPRSEQAGGSWQISPQDYPTLNNVPA